MSNPPRTVNEILLRRLAESGRDLAYYAEDGPGQYRPVYYAESRRWTLCVAAALRARGLAVGDRIGILARTRHEWVLADFGALLARCVTVGIYPTCTPDTVHYMLEHSGCRLLFVEDQTHLDAIAPGLAGLPDLTTLVSFEADTQLPESLSGFELLSFDALLAEGDALLESAEGELLEHAAAAQPDDLMTLVYTSGTTGPPKGAMLTHRNLVTVCEDVAGMIAFQPGDRSIVYLPLAHILQRYTVYLGLSTGVTAYYLADIASLGEVLPIAKPTILAAVPRVLEKIHSKATARGAELAGIQRSVFDWAFDVGHQAAQVERGGTRPGFALRAQHRMADRLVFSKVREKLGDSVRLIVSGGAPLSPEISEWFHAAGMLVVEGYGLTETSAPATANTPHKYRFGTVGQALPSVDLRLDDDGEILIRGPGVFSGYYRDELATAEAFADDGFFRSGDIGAIDDEGYLRITDRKKNLIITAGGKNVAPANLENLLVHHPLLGGAMVCGDRQPFLTVLLTLDVEAAAVWAEARGKDPALASLAEDAEMLAAVQAQVESVNARVARYESLKKWALLPVEWTPESGYLTPTLKLRRRAILADFGDIVDGFYAP